jgi:MFS family permease
MNSPTEASTPNSAKPTFVRFGVLALIASGAASLYLTRHCMAVTNEEIQNDLNFGSTEMGAVMGLFSLGYLLFQVPGGWLGNKIGTRWGLATLSIAWSILTLVTASTHGLLPLKIARFLFGAAQAGFVPITAKIIKDWIPEEKIGISAAFVTVSMSIGGALAMDVTGRLTGHFDWRVIFQMYALVGVFWSVAFVFLFRTKPAQHPWINQGEIDLIDGPAVSGTTVDERPDEEEPQRLLTPTNMVVLFCSVNLWAICIQSFFRAAGYNFFVTFFPEFLSRNFAGVDAAEAGIYSKWPLIGVVVGGLIGGFLIDRIYTRTGNKWLSRSAIGIASLVLTAIFTFASFYATTVAGFVTVIAIAAALSGAANPVAWAATIDVAGRHTAIVAGIMNMAGCMAGVLVTPILGGMMDILKGEKTEATVSLLGIQFTMTDKVITDWNQVIYMHAAFYIAAAACWIFIRPTKPLIPPTE